jgi:hypothetical protein
MLLDLLRCLLIFGVVTFGLAWPVAGRLALAPAEKIVAAVALSLLGVFLFGWAVYVFALPAGVWWALPVLGALGLAVRPAALVATWRDSDARALLIAQLLVTGWCVGWMAIIESYSGGGWAGDWFEHWERARFFLERWPLDRKFLVTYPLTARPPLVNVTTGAFLWLTRVDYAHYQLVTALLSSLAFLPAALLARRWARRGAAIGICAVLFMVNPLFVQNATFAWTKLPAAFFTLVALYFFLRAREPGAPPAFAALWAASLAAGLLAHFSAGPYAVPLALAWLVFGWPRRHDRTWRRATALGALAGALVLATWFGWAFAKFGAHDTLLSNSSATSRDVREGNQLVKIALNLRDTLVPHFLRPVDPAFIDQRSSWGWWRDWFFQCYQINLPLALGSVAWLALLRELWRAGRTAAAGARTFWIWFAATVVVLGVATHGARDHWGLAHICLQGLVLLGLAFLAARWSEIGRPWRLALVAGATVDFALGIALQFAVQSYALDRWLARGRSPDDVLRSYNEPAFMNLAGKIHNQLAFFNDVFAPPSALVLALLAAFLILALVRARAASPCPPPSSPS